MAEETAHHGETEQRRSNGGRHAARGVATRRTRRAMPVTRVARLWSSGPPLTSRSVIEVAC